MNNSLRKQAAQLEALLPQMMRAISPPADCDALSDLPIGQLRVLRALFARDLTAGELSAALDLSPSSISQFTQRLADAGLVEKADEPEDKRRRRVSLTEFGRELMSDRRELKVRRAAELLNAVPEETREAVIEGMKEILNGLSQRETLAASAEIERGIAT